MQAPARGDLEESSAWGYWLPLPCSPRKRVIQPTVCQESGQLNEPCHCGQTPRLPENKQRRGLEAATEAGRHDLPFWASTRLAGRQIFISIQAAQTAFRKQEVEPTAARLDPRAAPSINIYSAPVPCLNGVGHSGDRKNRRCLLLRKGWLGQRAHGQ